ncbi:uncharacterized protein [Primulina eburnea]|uniref:uncharacterized protein n=1 Tax=Primulina eburnea TaxID=1245227 RepID=UPI003C6C4A80
MVVLSLSFRPSLSSTQELVERICRSTENYGFCAGVFNKNANDPNADITRLCEIAVEQTLVHGTDARIFVTESKNRAKDKITHDLYVICETAYGFLLNEFEDASLAFAKRDYNSMLFNEEKCNRFVADCQKVIGYRVAPLSTMNNQMRVLISMSLITTSMIIDG